MRRLRILQIFNRYLHYGGEEASVFQIGDALQKNHQVEYFFGSTKEFFGPRMSLFLSSPLRAFHDFKVAAKLRRYQEVGNFDLWQIHNVMPGLSPSVYWTAFDLQVPVVHFLHNYRFGCVNGSLLNHGQPCQRCLGGNFWPAFRTACWHDSHWVSGGQALILLYLRRLRVLNRVNQWITLSQSQKQLHLRMGFPEDRISIVPHFYETNEPAPPLPHQGAVLFLSRLSPEKGGQDLLKAWTGILPIQRELWIGGTGPQETSLREQATSMPGVRFLGFLDNEGKNRAWANASFAVIPSIVPETFGRVVLEAWARKRPVIAYRIGALAETIQDGVNGILVEPGNTYELGRAIKTLADSNDLSQRMGSAGWDRLQNNFSQSLWLNRMDNVYERIFH